VSISHEYLIQHFLKWGGTHYDFKWVKVPGTTPYWKACYPVYTCTVYLLMMYKCIYMKKLPIWTVLSCTGVCVHVQCIEWMSQKQSTYIAVLHLLKNCQLEHYPVYTCTVYSDWKS
jgi:hypothetical protein